MSDSERKLAVLIDGDNTQAKLIEKIMAEASKHGKVTIKRIYADWTLPSMNSWKEHLNNHAIRPVQKFAYTKGKNSTDSALIIEAMDILHSNLVEGFCLVTSDSDFTGIAHRIREEGLFVMAIGKSDTPVALVRACELFTYTENLALVEGNGGAALAKPPARQGGRGRPSKREELPTSKITQTPVDIELIIQGYEMVADDDGIAMLSQIATAVRKIDPSFDQRTYGYRSFLKFFKTLDEFEIIQHDDGHTIYARLLY